MREVHPILWKVLKFNVDSAHAASDMLVLLSWATGIYTACVQSNPDFTSAPAWAPLLGSMAVLLDFLLDEDVKAKSSLQKSALVRTRRALRIVRAASVKECAEINVCSSLCSQNPALLPTVVKTLISRAKIGRSGQ